MKKNILVITSLILLCILTIGCTSTNANIDTSKELNKSLDILSNTVSRLDTIDNEYLISNELYSLDNTLKSNPSPHYSTKTILANSNSVIIEDNIEISEINLTEEIKKEIINRLYCDENGNCKLCKEKYYCDNDGICNNCNEIVICDEKGNCTSCGNTLILDENNNCSTCKKLRSKDCNYKSFA